VTAFYLGFQREGGAVLDVGGAGLPGTVTMPRVIAEPVRAEMAAARAAPYLLTVALDPGALTAIATLVDPGALHYFRHADGTVQPLPVQPPALTFQPGDAYIGVTPGAARLAAAEVGGASAAIARFLHLRDYFNAQKLAAALLEHLLALGGDPTGAGVLVAEAR
jgi:hypothetical protein